jgi:prepilin-type N-terminal cleavage/methylation domain-containing protein
MFKTKPTNTYSHRAFTLVEIMIVTLIITILLAIAIPNFVRARAASRQKSCVGNLRQIEAAKQQWAMNNNKGPSASPAWPADLVGPDKYIKGNIPTCPTTNVSYDPRTVNEETICPNATAPDGISGIDHVLDIP